MTLLQDQNFFNDKFCWPEFLKKVGKEGGSVLSKPHQP